MAKQFRLKAEEIRRLLPPIGGCFASDRITVDGCRVGLMFRDEPDFAADSGWRFVAGDESDEYMDDPSNHAIYDVNTIANYDPAIIPYLDADVGSELKRMGDVFVLVSGQPS